MPRGNKKGPMGHGPSTGRGLGFCTGHQEPGFTADAPRRGGAGRAQRQGQGQGRGRGMGMGRGQGRGMGRAMGATHHHHHEDEHQLTALHNRIAALEARLAGDSEES